MRTRVLALGLAAVLSAAACRTTPDEPVEAPRPPFPDGWRVVDLTRPLDADAPFLAQPDGFPFELLPLSDSVAGRRVNAFSMLETMGTHLEAPSALREGGGDVRALSGSQLLGDLIVIDAPPVTAGGALTIGETAVRAHEAIHGTVPRGSVVILRTGRGAASARSLVTPTDAAKGTFDFQGWSPDAIRFLVRERGVRIVGTDAPALDAGPDVPKAPAARAAADEGAWALVSVVDLVGLPERGAYVAVGVLPLSGAGGAPARVLAFVPPPRPRPATSGAASGPAPSGAAWSSPASGRRP